MKRIPLFVVAMVFIINTNAQITILSTDLLDVGDSIQLSSVPDVPPGFKPGPSGPDNHWDFSNLIMDTTTILSFVDPASTPYGAHFPGSNIAVEGMVEGLDIEGWAYGTKNISLFQIDGVAGSYDIFEGIIAPLNPPEVMFDFPVNYLDSLQQSNTVDIRMDSPEPPADSVRIKVVTSTDSRVDAWGEVITPVWIGDVLRYRNVRVTVDSVWAKIFGFWIYLESNTTISINYKYMANDIGYPVLQFSSDTSGTEYNMINYLLDAGLGENELDADNDVVISIYPNPSNHYVNIRYPKSEIRYSILIYDMFGRIMNELVASKGQGESRLDVSDYPAGMYQLVLKAEGREVSAKKFVVR